MSDTRQPINTVIATVAINVTSLKGPPVFTKDFYNVNIPIITAVNSSVETISAVDSDVEVRGQTSRIVSHRWPANKYIQ